MSVTPPAFDTSEPGSGLPVILLFLEGWDPFQLIESVKYKTCTVLTAICRMNIYGEKILFKLWEH